MAGDETQRGFAESEEDLLEEARRKTGLADFGGGPWREGLRVLLRAYDDEAHFKPQARGRVRADIVSVLAARLGVEEGWHRDPVCLATSVEAPVFVLGLPRTGTTAFHFLLAQDPAHQVLEYWLAARPRRRPPREDAGRGRRAGGKGGTVGASGAPDPGWNGPKRDNEVHWNGMDV